MDLGELGWSGVDRSVLTRDRDQKRAVVKAEMNVRIP
jgi:hypothetical protein